MHGGLDLGLANFDFSKTAGAAFELKFNFLILENSCAQTSVYQSHAPNKMWLSNSVKIGIEIDKFTLKVDSSFIIWEYNGHHRMQDLIMIGDQRFNIEIGYMFESK